MKRRAAREIALRVLYQSEIGVFELEPTISQVLEEMKPPVEVRKYALLLVEQIRTHGKEIDSVISEVSKH